jgi:anti-sigma factor RsiW
MQCNEVDEVLERDGIAPLPEAAKAHLAECDACRGYVADLTSIVATAHLLPIEVEPPARVWVSLRAQLESEGIIKTEKQPGRLAGASWLGSFGDLFRSRALATAALGIFLVGGIALQMQKPGTPPDAEREPFSEVAMALDQQERDLTSVNQVSTSDVDASLRQNLQTLDDFIADCKHRVKEEPQDDLAREYLSSAYGQKAELLSAMMERGGSVN